MKTFVMVRNVAVISLLTLLGILASIKAAGAIGYPPDLIMRGPHGAFHILEPDSETYTPPVKTAPSEETKSSQSVPMTITRGPHGAAFVVTEPGVGGPEGSGVYPGYPELMMRGSHGAFFPK
ncbi:MAG: hypothetical protein HC852_02855 [Acaryochloridaceae cyanobacterium RU_4_10]|nr:hypothetical protein [Acaryochloridaceae cyanobacterium RU_4_10]